MVSTMIRRLLMIAALMMLSCAASAATVQVAVAANFVQAMADIASAFARETGHRAAVSTGATGKLHAQIRNAAPFEVLLAADATTPARLETEGLTVPGTRCTYAIGKLVLWSAQPGFVDDQGRVLREGRFAHLALANPKAAPYGAAAVEVLNHFGLFKTLEPKLVQGENIAQTQQFVATGNAELGFLALSQVQKAGRLNGGSAWLVPAHLYSPIRQDAVMLLKGKDNPAASAFMTFLQSYASRAIIRSYGYDLESETGPTGLQK